MGQNIDKFRQEIRNRLREAKSETSDSVIANHSKFNEELEFHLESMKDELPPSIYDLLMQSGNLAYMKGVHAGLATGNEKASNLARVVSGLQSRVNSENPESNNDLVEINKSITGLVSIVFFGFAAVVLAIVFS